MNNYISFADKKILNDICFKILKQEKLPILIEELKFKSPLNGTKSRRGTCYWQVNRITKERKNFKIIITTVKAKYIEDEEGKYINKKTNKRVKRVIGEPISFKEIFNTLAHEIAHLKYKNHKLNHKKYTQHILKEMLYLLKLKGYYETKYLHINKNLEE